MILRPVADMLRNVFRSNARPARDTTAETVARLEQGILALVGNMPAMMKESIDAVLGDHTANC